MGTVAKIAAGGATHLVASTCYGTCSTAAATVAKVATIQDSQAFSLINGITIHIKFTYSNTATDPTLNVNSTGAKAIKRYGTTATGETSTASWYAGSVVSFTYDGTNWIQNDYKADTNTTYSAGTGLSLSSTTFNHSNSVTAQTTQKVYPIKIDAQGHISAYGTSPTTLSGYGITDAVLKSGDTMTGDLTIKVTSAYDDNSPSKLTLQTVDSTNSVTSTGVIYAFDGGANGANFVIRPGGNLFLGSGEAAYNHYAAAYTHSTGETTFITSDGGVHIQAYGQTIANRVGVQIDNSGNLVPEKADVATNNIGGIGTSTYKWANGYFTNINGVAVGDSPKFTDTIYTGIGLITVNSSTHVISTTAEANQNAFSTVKVGSTNVSADTTTDTLTLAGSNVTLTPDATNDKVTIGITSSNVTTALGYTPYDSTNPSGYTSNIGTITRVKTTAGAHSTINVSSGAAEFNVPTVPNDLLAFDAGNLGIALKSGDNVDTLDIGKTYYSSSSSISGALTGTPPTTSSGFKIITYRNYSGDYYNFQFATKYMAINANTGTKTDMGSIFFRYRYYESYGKTYQWSDWYILYTSDNLTSKTAASAGTAVSLVTTGEKYTWNNKSTLALGENSSTAYRGDRGKAAYDHSQLTSGNPHNVSKSDVGLGNVGNFKAVSTVASQGLTATEKSNARTNIGAGTGSVTSVTIKGGNGITVSDETAITGSGTRTITNSQQGIYNVIGTQTSSTAAWTGTLSAVSALYDGLTICYFLPYASVANTSVTLNLTLSDGTTTGAVACYLSTGRLTTHYAKGTNIIMTYYKKGSISIDGTATTAARWIAHADYNTNTNTWRNIYINGTSKTGTSTGTGYVNYKSGNSITVSGTYTADTKTDITFSIPSTTAPSYTVTATSPKAWSVNNAGVLATRWGNVIQIVLRLEGSGASTAAGEDGFSGKLSVSGGGYLPARPVTLMGYTGKTLLMGWLDTDGSLTVRANEAIAVASGNSLWLTGMFITNTDTTG